MDRSRAGTLIRKLATTRRPPRRTVRIVRHWTLSSTAKLSLALAFSVAVVLFLLWRLWRSDESQVGDGIDLRKVECVYRCERNHTFRALWQVEPCTCPECGQPAYPRERWTCDVHGVFEVTFRFRTDGRVSHYRLQGREWIEYDKGKGLRCPRCNHELRPVDPTRGARRLPRKGD